MLMPKRVRYRKTHRTRTKGRATRGNTIAFGDYALMTLDPGYLDAHQIEAARRAITHHIKRGGKLWIRVFPDKPITAKPAETRMGGGKGAPARWVALVKPGKIIFELAGVTEEVARGAMRLASHKLPVATHFFARQDGAMEAQA
ncbi:MAG: 50S ribosomal protein L16 [Chloroflexi bacterium]|nr:50S ribosomal protein L16 [Chloroflexota bacterium]